MSYSVNDFECNQEYDNSFFLDCPYPRCNRTLHPGPYDTLGTLLNEAEAHLVEEHNDRD